MYEPILGILFDILPFLTLIRRDGPLELSQHYTRRIPIPPDADRRVFTCCKAQYNSIVYMRLVNYTYLKKQVNYITIAAMQGLSTIIE